MAALVPTISYMQRSSPFITIHRVSDPDAEHPHGGNNDVLYLEKTS